MIQMMMTCDRNVPVNTRRHWSDTLQVLSPSICPSSLDPVGESLDPTAAPSLLLILQQKRRSVLKVTFVLITQIQVASFTVGLCMDIGERVKQL